LAKSALPWQIDAGFNRGQFMQKIALFSTLALLTTLTACSKKSGPAPMVGNDPVLESGFLSVANTQAEVNKALSTWDADHGDEHNHAMLVNAQSRLEQQVELLRAKLENDGLASVNQRNFQQAMHGHTKVYKFEGNYRVMVIPVQFADEKMRDASFFTPDRDGRIRAQDYLFGDNHANSMRQYYKHASMGRFLLEGEVTPIITVDKTLAEYGEAVPGNTDRNARGLVVDVLQKLKELKKENDWWDQFDDWDLSDYDKDTNFHEPDGFIDAVVLVYAGKSQASCQADFDLDNTRPPTADVPAGPRQAPSIECYNRIWPHRWGISLAPGDPRYSKEGPVVEGRQRPSMNGYKIHDGLFATDYNMQSEYSDISTFMHEFGHSLTLPDVYSRGNGNSTGAWELMSSNAPLFAQEFSTYSKISLGWLSPKVVRQGEETSAYLGAYNFVSEEEREDRENFRGPTRHEETVDGQQLSYDIVSNVPGMGEPVYRSIIVLTDPSTEENDVLEMAPNNGKRAAYSGRYDGASRALTVTVSVPKEGDATLSFDTFYQIETETNFMATGAGQEDVKVTVDFDLGEVKINGTVVEQLRLVSGDENYDSLNEQLASCKVAEVLQMRTRHVLGQLSRPEIKEFEQLAQACQVPSWVKKSYDLSAYRGQDVTFQVAYTTDAGYTEIGIALDNITFAGSTIDFESLRNDSEIPGKEFKLLVDGKEAIHHNQFYMMEYRTPGEQYRKGDKELSYNMDNNIQQGEQSMFLPAENNESLKQRFRLVEFTYQPGVLVWYFNSKFGRTDNNPAQMQGKGYLLVLNSQVKEVPLPSVLGTPDLFDSEGYYATSSEAYQELESEQNRLFACSSYTVFYRYTQGRDAECDDVSELDFIRSLRMDGKPLIYRREGFNEILPEARLGLHSAGNPVRRGAGMRTGLSTFRPAGSAPFAPYTIYKEQEGAMVLDKEMTATAPTFAAVSRFDDENSVLSARENMRGDTVVVEKTGLRFNVVAPSERISARYQRDATAQSNANTFRRPRAKIYFSWK
jgi:immune inhibitor A